MYYTYKDEYITINMPSQRSLLKITWSVRHQCMSLFEFNQSLSLILACVEKFHPQTIVIDSTHFNYRKTPELEVFFSRLEQHVSTGGNIALIIGSNLLGKLTLEHITKHHNNFKTFRKRREAIEWVHSFGFPL
ncbi:MAG TPA: hypothetical protein VIH57_06900 [Bacteroidales bacterium]